MAPPDLTRYTPSKMGAPVFEAALAMAGQGVAMLTPAFSADGLATGRLFQPFPLTANDGYHYWLVYPEGRRNHPKIRAFRTWILEEMGQHEDHHMVDGAKIVHMMH